MMPCPRCDDSGWAIWAEGGVIHQHPCGSCVKGLALAGIQPLYYSAGIADFPAEIELGDVLNWDGAHPGWLVVGPVGTGKTHLACAVVKRLLQREVWAHFVKSVRLLDLLRETYNDETKGAARQELGWIQRASVLVIDDLGAERVNDWVRERMETLVDGWYEARRPLLVTSNLTILALREHLGPRIASRLAEMTRPLAMGGADRRLSASRRP